MELQVGFCQKQKNERKGGAVHAIGVMFEWYLHRRVLGCACPAACPVAYLVTCPTCPAACGGRLRWDQVGRTREQVWEEGCGLCGRDEVGPGVVD